MGWVWGEVLPVVITHRAVLIINFSIDLHRPVRQQQNSQRPQSQYNHRHHRPSKSCQLASQPASQPASRHCQSSHIRHASHTIPSSQASTQPRHCSSPTTTPRCLLLSIVVFLPWPLLPVSHCRPALLRPLVGVPVCSSASTRSTALRPYPVAISIPLLSPQPSAHPSPCLSISPYPFLLPSHISLPPSPTHLTPSLAPLFHRLPPPVQHECIPQALLGMDIICQAKSGMGKTAVFVLATLHQVRYNTQPHCHKVTCRHCHTH
jgi:hypothetical protein